MSADLKPEELAAMTTANAEFLGADLTRVMDEFVRRSREHLGREDREPFGTFVALHVQRLRETGQTRAQVIEAAQDISTREGFSQGAAIYRYTPWCKPPREPHRRTRL